MAFNYRCSLRAKCGARKTLRMLIEKYVRTPKCPGCRKDTLKTVNTKEKARTKRRTCKCDGYHYPHSTGTEPWCENALIGPTDDDYEDRYR